LQEGRGAGGASTRAGWAAAHGLGVVDEGNVLSEPPIGLVTRQLKPHLAACKMEAKDTLAAYSSNPSLAPALRSTADTCQQGVLLEQVEPSSRR